MSVHVFDTMGTTVSIRFADRAPDAGVLEGVEAVFDPFDRRFSLYRADSEISSIARGELSLPRASGMMRDTYAEALDWRRLTHDCFTPHRPDGVIDLSGLIKAKAMDAAADALEQSGEADWLMNAGGDILSRGSTRGETWRAAIVDPLDRAATLGDVALGREKPALATSGTAERGEHIWRRQRPVGDGASTSYRQVSVVAPDIVTADVLATAILAGGQAQLDDALDTFDIEVLAVAESGELVASAGLRRAWGLLST
ncbi:MAG: FAD:protein transferase, partial [Subtercola sp.]|nr:FAD:protein transferase [Subtercola sp.]